MRQVITLRNAVLGLASWAIPFFGAFAFFTPEGTLSIPEPLFKSIMVVVFGGIGTALLVFAFRKTPATVMAGLTLGLFWAVINWALDLAILLPMSGMAFGDYVIEIGMRYLLIPIIAIAIGYVAERTSGHI